MLYSMILPLPESSPICIASCWWLGKPSAESLSIDRKICKAPTAADTTVRGWRVHSVSYRRGCAVGRKLLLQGYLALLEGCKQGREAVDRTGTCTLQDSGSSGCLIMTLGSPSGGEPPPNTRLGTCTAILRFSTTASRVAADSKAC
jgi:hypothetical protein